MYKTVPYHEVQHKINFPLPYLKMFYEIGLFKRHELATFALKYIVSVGGDVILILLLVIRLKIAFTALEFR